MRYAGCSSSSIVTRASASFATLGVLVVVPFIATVLGSQDQMENMFRPLPGTEGKVDDARCDVEAVELANAQQVRALHPFPSLQPTSPPSPPDCFSFPERQYFEKPRVTPLKGGGGIDVIDARKKRRTPAERRWSQLHRCCAGCQLSLLKPSLTKYSAE